MKKVLTIGIVLTLLITVVGCGNDEAKRKYEQEKQKLEQMQEDHSRELSGAIATGASDTDILILKIEQSRQEKDQADLVHQLAIEAGMDE